MLNVAARGHPLIDWYTTQQQKFQQMSEQIIGRLDDMGKRVDDLEKNIGDLMQQVDSKDDPTNPNK